MCACVICDMNLAVQIENGENKAVFLDANCLAGIDLGAIAEGQLAAGCLRHDQKSSVDVEID